MGSAFSFISLLVAIADSPVASAMVVLAVLVMTIMVLDPLPLLHSTVVLSVMAWRQGTKTELVCKHRTPIIIFFHSRFILSAQYVGTCHHRMDLFPSTTHPPLHAVVRSP